jgi:RNA polymerase sigma-70 factor (ECF subfamily)
VYSRFEDLLAAAKAGDEGSFVELFRSVQPALLRYLSTLGGANLAEDAAAETWLSVVRGLPRFKGDEAGWRAWVFTIGHARLRDAQRKAVRTPVPVDTEEVLSQDADVVDVHTVVEELISTEAALALIGRLPRDQAAAVLLRYVAGLDVAQTATVLGKRPGTVRVAVHRGLKRLETLMAPQTPPADGTPEKNPSDGVTNRGHGTVTK